MKDLKVLKKLCFKVRQQTMFISEHTLNVCLPEQDLCKSNPVQVQVQKNKVLHKNNCYTKKQSFVQKQLLLHIRTCKKTQLYKKTRFSYTCTCIRPLLNLKRENITTVCQDFKMPIYPDQSNKSVQYSRNRIRKQIIPSIKYFLNVQVENSLFKLAELLTKEQLFLYSILRNTSSNLLL